MSQEGKFLSGDSARRDLSVEDLLRLVNFVTFRVGLESRGVLWVQESWERLIPKAAV